MLVAPHDFDLKKNIYIYICLRTKIQKDFMILGQLIEEAGIHHQRPVFRMTVQ